MTREDAIYELKNAAWLGTDHSRARTEEAVKMAISALNSLEEVYAKGYNDGFMQAEVNFENDKALSQEPCDDAVNRQAVLEMAYDMSEIDGEHFTEPHMVVDVEDIQKLTTVTQKSGKWDRSCTCSVCGNWRILESEKNSGKYKFCPNCGAKMVEPQESEE